MTDTTKFIFEVTDGGSLGKTTKDTVNLKDTLDSTAVSANKVSKALQGAKAASAPKSSTTPTREATPPQGPSANSKYNIQRGITGTGASGRDFAKESEGLGGLVRVYATFAANIFAASIAFKALSDAMDAANLAKGLDQLGAASGKNLTFTAKKLVETADGAISLKDALKATAAASAAGLSSKNIEQMGVVAKKASQALGVDMGDAISRISRGVTKLEPELLDELGLFTKLGPSTENYARSVGKSVTSLTDFEKRQAFANAVLKEGIDKFGQLDLVANPYAKITANLTNLSNSGLAVVNNVLSPLLNILAQSPTALAAGIVYIAKTLIGQALPALGQWREGLVAQAKTARETALEIAGSFDITWAENLQEKFKIPRLNEEVSAYKSSLDELKKSTTGVTLLQDPRVAKATAIAEMGNTGSLTKLINTKIIAIEKLDSVSTPANKRQIAALEKEVEWLTKVKTETQAIVNINKELAVAHEEVTRQTEAEPKIPGIRQKQVNDAVKKAGRLETLAPVSSNVKEFGYRSAIDKLNEDVTKNGLTGLNKFRTLFTGTLGAMATQASLFWTAWGFEITVAIAAAFAAFELFDHFLATATKETETFNNATDNLKSSVELAGKTLDSIAKKGDIGFTIETVQAKANALNELSDGALAAAQAYKEMTQAQGAWSKFWDKINIINPFKQTSAQKMSEDLGGAVTKSLELVRGNEVITKQAAAAFDEILGVGVSEGGTAGIEAALNKLSDSGRVVKSLQISKEIAKISLEANNTASTLTAFNSAMDETSKQVNDLNNSLKATDTQSKIGESLTASSFKLAEALKDPYNGVLALQKIVKDTNLLSILPQGTSAALSKAGYEINQITSQIGESNRTIQETSKSLNALKKANPGDASGIALLQNGLNDALKGSVVLKARAKELIEQFKHVGDDMFTVGIEKIQIGLKAAMSDSSISLQQGYLSAIKSAGGYTAAAEGDLRKQQIDAQETAIKATYSQIEQSIRNTQALDELTNATNLIASRDKLDKIAANPQQGLRSDAYAEEVKNFNKLNETFSVLVKKRELIYGEKVAAGVKSGTQSSAKTGAFNIKGYQAAVYSKDDIAVEAAKELESYYSSAVGLQQKLVGAEKDRKLNVITTYAAEQKELDTKVKTYQDLQITTNNTDLAQIKSQQDILGFYDQSLQTKKEQLEVENLSSEQTKISVGLVTDLNTLEKVKSELIKANLTNTKAYGDTEEGIATVKAKISAADINRTKLIEQLHAKQLAEELTGEETLAARRRDRASKELSYNNAIKTAELSTQEALLAIDIENQNVSEEQAITKKASIERDRLSLKIAEDTLAIAQEKAVAEANYNKQKQLLPAGSATVVLDAENTAIQAQIDLRAESLKASTDAQAEAIKITEDQSTKLLSANVQRIKGFQSIVENTAQSMSDALVDFAVTGKQSFSKMIKSMIIDMVKFEEKRNLTELMKVGEDGKGGLKGIITSGVNFLFPKGKPTSATKDSTVSTATEAAAKKLATVGGKSTAKEIAKESQKITALGASEVNPMYVQVVGNGFSAASRFSAKDVNKIFGDTQVAGPDASGSAAASAASVPSDWFKQEEDFAKSLTDKVSTGVGDAFVKGGSITDSISGCFGDAFKTGGDIFDTVGGCFSDIFKSGGDLFTSIGSSLGSLFSGGGGGSGGDFFSGVMDSIGSFFANANGGVYDQGRVAFAKGGAFTNTIVTKPTTFAFAKGIGLMGEAGPEAIMPLTRGANGTLGVQNHGGSGGSVDVVVNNYSTSKATTKETTDARGNRRIEVIVGEMTAAEISRPNSPIQSSMRGTFGIAPQLTRR